MPLPIVFSRRFAPDCLLSAFCPEGTHKGCPYRLSSLGVLPCEGHPQGVPLPIVFSRRYALGRAPTRGAPTDCLLSAFALGRAPTRGAPTDCLLSGRYRCLLSALCPGEAFCPLGALRRAHKGRPYRLSSLGVMPWGGRPQGAPLPIVFSGRYALGRAPTRGAPTDCLLSAFYPGKGAHKGCPYRLSSLGVWGRALGGHPQGAPLPIVFSRRLALIVFSRRAPTRGAPTDCLLSAFGPAKGTHKGCPYRLSSLGPGEGAHKGRLPIVLRRAPTRGAPTDCLLSAFCPAKGTHKGCPYRLSSLGVLPWEGRTQGVPLPIVFSRGTHKGCPYRLSSLGVWPCEGHPQGVRPWGGVLPWGGHPQGVPLPIVFSRRFALRRAPTRGAPTDCLLSAFGPAKGTHKGCPYPIQAASRGFF